MQDERRGNSTRNSGYKIFVFHFAKNKDVLRPGRTTLLPAAYYEATILQERVLRPCLLTEQQGSCRHFTYASLENLDQTRGDLGIVGDGSSRNQPPGGRLE